MHAGDLIKLGFTLGGNFGLSIGSFSSTPVACPSDTPHLVDGAHEGTPSGLSYPPGASHYSYGWQTDAAWAGTCRQFSLQLNDGTAAAPGDVHVLRLGRLFGGAAPAAPPLGFRACLPA